jgi:hypothetical protein
LPAPSIGTSARHYPKIAIDRLENVGEVIFRGLGIATGAVDWRTIQIRHTNEVAVLPAVGRLYGGKEFFLGYTPASLTLGQGDRGHDLSGTSCSQKTVADRDIAPLVVLVEKVSFFEFHAHFVADEKEARLSSASGVLGLGKALYKRLNVFLIHGLHSHSQAVSDFNLRGVVGSDPRSLCRRYRKHSQ